MEVSRWGDMEDDEVGEGESEVEDGVVSPIEVLNAGCFIEIKSIKVESSLVASSGGGGCAWKRRLALVWD